MQLFTTQASLNWGELDVPLLGVSTDWFGKNIIPPLGFSLVADPEHFWFIAMRQAPTFPHPDAPDGQFFPELWKYDVSELFLGDPSTGNYLEFNLAANGAWWAAKFDSPRNASPTQPDFKTHIASFSENDDTSSWICALRIPLDFLKEHIRFNLGTTGNVCFIMNSPAQTFHTVTKLLGAEPDYHQPAHFSKIIPCELPAV